MRMGFLELVAILALLVFLFGASKLPSLAKSAGKSIKIFKKEISSDEDKSESGESDDGKDE